MKIKNYLSKNFLFLSLFFLILLLGFIIRIWDLGKNPAGFFCDEASIGYNAYSILKTGKDEWGSRFPLFFRAFGEYKNPLDIYTTLPFILIFGINEFSVRLSSVLFSIACMIVIFFLGKEEIKSKFGLILMLIFAITPWSIHLSKINLEGFNIFLFLILSSLFFLNRYFKKKKTNNLLIFSLISGISLYSYFPARIIVPIFIFLTFFYLFLSRKELKTIFISFIIFFIVSLPLVKHLSLDEGMNRWQQVSIFGQKNTNPYKKIISSYLLHFSPDFLFLRGDIDMNGQFVTRHSVRGMGEFYLWQLPLIILGLFTMIKKKSKLLFPTLLLLFLYPVPSSLTQDLPPQATRSLLGIIPFTLLTGYGLWYVNELIQKSKLLVKTLIICLIFLVFIFSVVKLVTLTVQYPLYSSDYWGWQYGPREIIKYFLSQKDQYNELYMTGNFNAPQIFLEFYDPEKKCQNCFIGGFDKYNPTKKQLFAFRAGELNDLIKDNSSINFQTKKTILLPNNNIEFLIGSFVNNDPF